MTSALPRLLVVLDPGLAQARGIDLLQLGVRMLEAGAPLLWLRDHPEKSTLSPALIPTLRERAAALGSLLIRSDHIGAWTDACGDGVHLSARARAGCTSLLGNARSRGHHPLGASLHAEDDPAAPEFAALDYATLSPLRPTVSKPGYGPALGKRFMRSAAERAPFALFALGGVTPDDFADLAPVHGIAMMGPLHVHDPAPSIEAALRALTATRPDGTS